MSEENIIEGKKFDDVIFKNASSIDIHTSEGKQIWENVKTYDVPYRCLVPKFIDNLLVCGRCISATHKALGSLRFIPCCMGTSQACGVSASLCVSVLE